MSQIHPTAIVSKNARLGREVEIGPYAVVEDDVELGDGCRLESQAVVKRGARIGKSVTIGNFAVISGLPQDLSFDPSVESYARIGDGTQIREGVTVSRSTRAGEATEIGANCYLMAASHVGHDCHLGDRVVMANASLLAGHVEVGSFTFMGGNASVHQFCRIGEGCMVGGLSAVTLDIPPFTMTAERSELFGLNLVGLRRRGIDRASIKLLQSCYRQVLLGHGKVRELAAAALDTDLAGSEESRRFLAFFLEGKRGFAAPNRKGRQSKDS